MCDDPPCLCTAAGHKGDASAGHQWTRVEQAALADLFRRHYQLAVSQVMMWTGAKLEDAEDAVMDAFQAASTDPGQWSQVRNPAGWLCTVAVRCYKRPPGRKRRPPGVIDEPPTEAQLRAFQSLAADDQIEMSLQLLLVREVLQTLPDDDRVLIVASMNGLSWAETARLVGLDDQYVRNRAKAIRAMLQRRFADLHMTGKKGRSK
jgi:RNA polymerase sigma factor (sigma-70 family)